MDGALQEGARHSSHEARMVGFCMRRAHSPGHARARAQHARSANDEALESDARVLSSFCARNGTRFWIITEADRSVTTVLLPEEYWGRRLGRHHRRRPTSPTHWNRTSRAHWTGPAGPGIRWDRQRFVALVYETNQRPLQSPGNSLGAAVWKTAAEPSGVQIGEEAESRPNLTVRRDVSPTRRAARKVTGSP